MTATQIAPLPLPLDGLEARTTLIDQATDRLDLQYYQWDSDTAGYLLLDRLIAAADRGVSVRLLVDDLKFRKRTRSVAALSRHPNLSVRLFNPWTKRAGPAAQAYEFVTRFSKLDRRMHNKLLVADGQRAIVGGRNIADSHFGLHPSYNYVDYDLLLDGPGTAPLQRAFEAYWGSEPATPASDLYQGATQSDLDAVRTLIQSQIAERARSLPSEFGSGGWRSRAAANTLDIDAAALQVTFDVPGPTSDTHPTQVAQALHAAVDNAEAELVVSTAFFVPNEIDVAWYRRIVERGIRIRLFTNSLASNPGTISNSGLDQSRRAVVEAGVELYELRADAAAKPDWETAPNVGRYLGLHAKLYTIDRTKVFLGSLNLDPRSKVVNTEVGMLIDNAALAARTADRIAELMAPNNSWRVSVGTDKRLTWSHDTETIRREPARGPLQRIENTIFKLLPIKRYI